jgi:hypothetical protein
MGYRKIKKPSVKNLLLAFTDSLKAHTEIPCYVYADIYPFVNAYIEMHDEIYMDVDCPACNKTKTKTESNGKTVVETT